MFIYFKKIADCELFQTAILFLIILNAIFLGLETVPSIMSEYGTLIVNILVWSQIIFVIEILIRILSYGPKSFSSFFSEFWNRFDFTIVALSFFPLIGGFVTIARIFRVLRILRIFSLSDTLRGYLDSLKSSFTPIIIACIFYGVLVYIVGITGYYLFSEIHPEDWGTLLRSVESVIFLSIFQDVRNILGPAIHESPLSIFFLVGFYSIEITLLIKLIKK